MKSRSDVINNYYNNFFDLLCNSGIQGQGSKYIHEKIEACWESDSAENILEIGAGDGAHFKYVRGVGRNASYTALDIRRPKNPDAEIRVKDGFVKVSWALGSAEKLPFADESFDRVVSTCLFHHLDDPYAAFQEVLRVLKPGGEFGVGMPTDPGILNRLIKRIYTFRRAKILGYEEIELTYALDHQNQIFGIMAIFENVFSNHKRMIKRFPFGWLGQFNFNLLVVAHASKKRV